MWCCSTTGASILRDHSRLPLSRSWALVSRAPSLKVVRKIQSPQTQGEEGDHGISVDHSSPCAGSIAAGGTAVDEQPDALGPRNCGQNSAGELSARTPRSDAARARRKRPNPEVTKRMINIRGATSNSGLRDVSSAERGYPRGALRAARIHQHPAWRQLELARPDLDAGQLSDHRVAETTRGCRTRKGALAKTPSPPRARRGPG